MSVGQNPSYAYAPSYRFADQMPPESYQAYCRQLLSYLLAERQYRFQLWTKENASNDGVGNEHNYCIEDHQEFSCFQLAKWRMNT